MVLKLELLEMVSFNNKVGALSTRVTNPLEPKYQDLGRTEKTLRQDIAYAEPLKEKLPRQKINRMKPEWLKSTVIPVIEDKKVNTNVITDNPSAFSTAANVDFIVKVRNHLRETWRISMVFRVRILKTRI